MKLSSMKTITAFAACGSFAFLTACGGGSKSSTPPANTITTSGSNVVPISVNSGPEQQYPNGVFTSVTVCVPGTSTCQTIDGILVDTGSYGLRILSSALTGVSLPAEKNTDGNPIAECVAYVDSYTWGPVETADVTIGSEKASSVPIQVMSDTDYPAPVNSCTSSDSPADTAADLLANGILGVGMFAQDCGPPCPASTFAYYECTSSTAQCTSISVTASQEVVNPVALFPSDNNGVVVELPALSGGAPSLSGSLVFGIATETNNTLNGATVYQADDYGNFTTTFQNGTYTGSFIDSGSNALFFPDTSLPTCDDGNFFCPTSTQNLSATNKGGNGTSGTVDFSIADANTLFSNAADFAFGDLGGPVGTPAYFDWGLPFFFGRNVYVAIAGTTAPNGTPPYWAY